MKLIAAFCVFITCVVAIFAIAAFAPIYLSNPKASVFNLDASCRLKRACDETRSLAAFHVADNWYSRFKGLSDKSKRDALDGMIFQYDEPKEVSYVMRDMRFDLDFAFLDETGTIVDIRRDIKKDFAGTINSTGPVSAVIEMPSKNPRTDLLELGSKVEKYSQIDLPQ